MGAGSVVNCDALREKKSPSLTSREGEKEREGVSTDLTAIEDALLPLLGGVGRPVTSVFAGVA